MISLDGLKDCEDPECCKQEACSGKQLCMVVENPKDILKNLTNTERAVKHFSFWDRIKFLVAEIGHI